MDQLDSRYNGSSIQVNLRGGSQKIFIKTSISGFGNPLINNDSFTGLLELLIHSCMHSKYYYMSTVC